MAEVLLKLALAVLFSGICALVYLRLAKRRANVRRESSIIFGLLLLFSAIRLFTTDY